MKMNAELRNLAKDLKNSAAKAKAPQKTKQANPQARPQCGKQGRLATDYNWRDFRYGVFDKVKNDRGRNDYLLAALARCVKRHDSSIR